MYFLCVASPIQHFICDMDTNMYMDMRPCGTGWFVFMIA